MLNSHPELIVLNQNTHEFPIKMKMGSTSSTSPSFNQILREGDDSTTSSGELLSPEEMEKLKNKKRIKRFHIKIRSDLRHDILLKSLLRKLRNIYLKDFNSKTNFIKIQRG
jgi:hypothetical protein